MNDMEYERLMEVLNNVESCRRTPDFTPKSIYPKTQSPWLTTEPDGIDDEREWVEVTDV